MYRNLLEAWWPIILAGVIAASSVVILAYYIRRTILYLLTTIASLISFIILILSIFAIGKWADIGIGMFAISVLLGVNIGTLCSFLVKQK
ncbi:MULTISPECIES: hypothetical protein [Clostridia]|uniref:hypothetical protein n=1 Tax=Clostridia TaxID=186801 RepID=UPI0011C23993|nr:MULTISPECIES: hypothetical protein [Clostridia]